jgi:phosphoglycerol transferase MdoB-like AlkP superfamily enzyme
MDVPTDFKVTDLSHPSRGFRRYSAVAVLAVVVLVLSFVTRVALIAVHGGWPASRSLAIARAFASGTGYDALVTMWLLLPLVLYLTLATARWLARRVNRVLLFGTVAVAVAGALFVAMAEVLFFSEFDGRFNFVAVDYLIYPTEVVNNIWESYPTGWIVAGIIVVAAGTVYVARRRIRASIDTPAPLRNRLIFAGGYLVLLAALTLAASPRLARVSEDRALNEVASNGYYAFWGAFWGQGTSYDALYATRDTAATVPRLRELLTDSQSPTAAFSPRTTLRHVARTRPARRLNVVVVLEESLGSQYIGALHPETEVSLTPRFDSIAAEGTLLTHAYSTGNRTIRALEATTTSLPPLPGISVVRRAESVDLFTLPALLRSRGYATEFIYGGRALFDGMGNYMRNNGMERVVEQKDYPKGGFTTAWGVADEAIFDKTLTEMDSLHALGKPFYTLVLSVSNHRPYTYPAGRIGADPNERKRVNVVQYADWALGRFIRSAKTHAFFENTVFVLMGDHGPRVYGAAEIPLPSYSVPVVFYGPGIVPSGVRLGEIASSMDVPPTVLGLLGGDYDSKFFGRDVLSPEPRSGLAVMTHNNEIALMRGNRLAVLGLRGVSTVYDIDSIGGLHRNTMPDASGTKLVEDAIAYFQTADELYRRGDYHFDHAQPSGSAKTTKVALGTKPATGR